LTPNPFVTHDIKYDIDFDLGLYGQLGVGTNSKQTLPMFVKALKNEKTYLICCGSFETVSNLS